MDEQDLPDENHETSDDCDRDPRERRPGSRAGVPGGGHGFPSEGFDDCGYVPEEWELEGPAASISLGDAADVDPALLAAIAGPDGLGGNALCQAYGQDQAADVLRPGPVLAALTEQAAADVGRLSDEQLMGALSAARRLENRAAYLQAVAIAEFARRRAAQAAAAAAARPAARQGARSGDFPDAELAMELLASQAEAGARLEAAACLTSRLPGTLAGLAAGSVDYARASIVVFYTGSLGDADAARADEILAAAAPGLRPDQLARKAAALEMKLDPQAAKDRKERAATHDRRVEVRREASGNASLSGRELSVADVMASKSHLDAVAARLRAAGHGGTLDHLRALALTELTQGRDPLSLLTPPPRRAGRRHRAGPRGRPRTPTSRPDPDVPRRALMSATRPRRDATAPPAPASRPRSRSRSATRATAPFPATINLLVPAGTLLGWSAAPGWAGGWGLLDPDDTRDIVRAASQHPATRWCYTYHRPRRHRTRPRLRPRPPPLDTARPPAPPRSPEPARSTGPASRRAPA